MMTHITSGGVLAGAKRVEVQKAQAAVLNTLTESRQFDKIKISKKVKEDKARTPVHLTTPQQPCRYCGEIHQTRQFSAYGKMCMECNKIGHFQKVCSSRSRLAKKMEQEVSQGYTEDDIENSEYQFSMLWTKLIYANCQIRNMCRQ